MRYSPREPHRHSHSRGLAKDFGKANEYFESRFSICSVPLLLLTGELRLTHTGTVPFLRTLVGWPAKIVRGNTWSVRSEPHTVGPTR